MSNNTGVFGLSGYNDKNIEGLIPDKTRESFREYGYFACGATLISRIDYSNDTQTSTTRGNATLTKAGGRCVENSNFGYFFGAQAGAPPGNAVERIDYSNDNQNLSIRGSLTHTRYDFGGASNNNYGYCAGGFSLNFVKGLPSASVKGLEGNLS